MTQQDVQRNGGRRAALIVSVLIAACSGTSAKSSRHPDKVTCAGVPSCGPDRTTYWDRVECEADGDTCLETQRCDSVAYCRPDPDPVPEDDEPPEDPVPMGGPPPQ